MVDPRETIYALSSGRPPAAIAVVRISGPQAGAAVQALTGRSLVARRATVAQVRHPASGETIDEGIALWFPGPASATGEDMAELHVHGGRAVIAAALGALGQIAGCRPAEPGEFTRRAFENGKVDLTRVEGLADLIAADTEGQRAQAYRQLSGWLGDRIGAWRRELVRARALVEAGLDFVDENDLPKNVFAEAREVAGGLRSEIAAALADGRRGERVRDGVTIAIAGAPNVGKSSLFNRLVRRDAAITSPTPGTTRDVIEAHLDLGGVPVVILDTAGLRTGGDLVEQEGIRRAEARAAAADLVLWVVEAGTEGRLREGVPERLASLGEMPLGAGEECKECGAGPAIWTVVNKIDLPETEFAGMGPASQIPDRRRFGTSARTGEGLGELATAMQEFAAGLVRGGEPAVITRERHRRALEDAAAALDRALSEEAGGGDEIVAEELRLAGRALERLLGRVDVEDVLDVIFRDFCIGK